jgi:acetyl esterase/lipase
MAAMKRRREEAGRLDIALCLHRIWFVDWCHRIRVFVLTWLAWSGMEAFAHAENAPAGIEIRSEVSFLRSNRLEKADLYIPPLRFSRPLPAMVMIHGGGWTGGSKSAAREVNVGTNLAYAGYLVMSIDYLLARNGRAVWPTNLWDCKRAVRWLRTNASALGVDPARIGVMGGSAGGHLAAMVALTRPEDSLEPPESGPSTSVRCCIDLYGISDLASYHDVTMLDARVVDAPELYRSASPIRYVRRQSPPFLILHGTADRTVKVEQSEKLAQALQAVGANAELVIVPEAPHTFHLEPKQRDLRPLVLAFLARHLAL